MPQNLTSLAVSGYPRKNSCDDSNSFALPKTCETWLDGCGPGLLLIYGVEGSHEVAQQIFHSLVESQLPRRRKPGNTRDIVVFFKFDQHDERYRSITGMLNTIIAQMITQMITQLLTQDRHRFEAAQSLYEEMRDSCSWTWAELFFLFKYLLERHEVVCILDGIHHCGPPGLAFLREVCYIASLSEDNYRILITSDTDMEVRHTLVEWPMVSLNELLGTDHGSGVHSGLAHDNLIAQFIEDNPRFVDLETVLIGKFSRYEADVRLRQLALNQLSKSGCCSTRTSSRKELDELLPSCFQDLISQILSNITSETRRWARKILTWVLYADRPVDVYMLGVALALEEGLDDDPDALESAIYRDVALDIDVVFGGLFTVEQNEITLYHPQVRDFMLNADNRKWYFVGDTAHQDIADACAMYFSVRAGRLYMRAILEGSSTNSLQSRSFIYHSNFG